jgi:hypothetical protein
MVASLSASPQPRPGNLPPGVANLLVAQTGRGGGMRRATLTAGAQGVTSAARWAHPPVGFEPAPAVNAVP